MPYPGETFISAFGTGLQVVADELRQYYALVQGWMSTEHNEDGTHGNVTAKSINLIANATTGATGNLISDGTGAFDGDVTADADGTPVVIGSDAAFGPGVRMTNGTLSKWRISASQSGGLPILLIRDELQTADTGVIDLIRTSAGAVSVYELRPHASYISLLLGTDATSQRIAEVNAAIVRATSGYYERFRTVAAGEWITPAYDAGNFAASVGTWGVDSADVTTYAYTLVGKTMTVAFDIRTTDVSAAPTELRIAIPGSFTAAKQTRNLITTIDAGGAETVGFAQVSAAGTVIALFKNIAGAAWTLTTADNTYVIGQIVFEVQ
jgi:hypothetical protein